VEKGPWAAGRVGGQGGIAGGHWVHGGALSACRGFALLDRRCRLGSSGG
jgi:hypothetical protein